MILLATYNFPYNSIVRKKTHCIAVCVMNDTFLAAFKCYNSISNTVVLFKQFLYHFKKLQNRKCHFSCLLSLKTKFLFLELLKLKDIKVVQFQTVFWLLCSLCALCNWVVAYSPTKKGVAIHWLNMFYRVIGLKLIPFSLTILHDWMTFLRYSSQNGQFSKKWPEKFEGFLPWEFLYYIGQKLMIS